MIEIEEKTAHVLVVDFATSVSLLLGYHLDNGEKKQRDSTLL